ncbi:bifunctional phosphoribosylaminoimidazolecarboxamide formyltransferase/IMP cyclohydrolase [Caldalkalibacillus salinus]|uniref:bifunctional phosphoribosylaminoimidazolecarboxamide formyltransferase/IMP cyclohydrolase n=1 Tax=Caldalkalibacillus salinus TaxID=2803787 RepID=UPI001924C28C|nr:bifunctional phosphoribosylaminoimidazolecarboxamide formyltransferase/IMP cyclohydrolase [Caldalkalibacillus salinus]
MAKIKRALISVSDKTGIVPFAKQLADKGVEIISTGGTSRLLQDSGVDVINISEVTGFPEILDGRVKTLHPRIHSGILAMRGSETHQQQLAEHQITPIDLVVVNLYPFSETIAKPDVTFADAIENIDIGGPSMLRAAAKNHADVTVIVDQSDYETVLTDIEQHGNTTEETRRALAAKVYRHTAAYDSLIASYLSEEVGEEAPEKLSVTFEKVQDLRYGENPHQKASFYRTAQKVPGSLTSAEQLHGKALSYNNINDADAALSMVREFTEPTVVAVKHMNPCGVGTAQTIEEAYDRAYEADPVSIFGGIIAANRPIDERTAQRMHEIFLEIIIAPDFTAEALNILQQKKNIRLLKIKDIVPFKVPVPRYQTIVGGLLVQDQDVKDIKADDLQVVTERQPTEEEIEQLLFSWKIVKHVKSNAIVLAKDSQTVGVGAGQMNRVGAAKIAIDQAGVKSKGAVLASDAFFPMPDTVEEAAKSGVSAIIQPGGSIKDEDVIKEANNHGIAMVFTGVRHFKH